MKKNLTIGVPQKLKASGGFLIELVLLIVVCGLFVWFLIMPKMADLQTKQNNLDQLTDQQQKTEQKLKQITVMVNNLKSSPDYVDKLDQALPLNNRTSRLKVLLDDIANSSGVTVGDVSVSSLKADNIAAGNKALLADPFGPQRSLEKLTGSIFVIGTFPQLKAFLEKLEASSRLVDIKELSIDSATNGALNLKLSVMAYSLVP